MPKNWQTTLAGFAFAFLQLYFGGANAKSAVVAAGLATIGTLARDHDNSAVKVP